MVTKAGDVIFLDTSFIVAATVDCHPGHAPALRLLAELVGRGAFLSLSGQVCREFATALTRAPIGGRVYSPGDVLDSLEDWLAVSTLLEENGEVFRHWERLVGKYDVHGKQVHDCNIVATMLAHRIGVLVTRNADDFRRYREGISIMEPGRS